MRCVEKATPARPAASRQTAPPQPPRRSNLGFPRSLSWHGFGGPVPGCIAIDCSNHTTQDFFIPPAATKGRCNRCRFCFRSTRYSSFCIAPRFNMAAAFRQAFSTPFARCMPEFNRGVKHRRIRFNCKIRRNCHMFIRMPYLREFPTGCCQSK